MDAMSGDKWRTVWAMTVARIWRSEEYRRVFLVDPKAALKEIGITLPPGTDLRILQDTPTMTHVVAPRDLDIHQVTLEQFVAFFGHLLPLPEGHELRLVQNTEKTHHLVIPLQPEAMQAGELTEAELMAIAGGGTEATTTNTTEAVEVETTEVTVTETTVVQDAEATTTVVAVAELVAT